jgi:hypothetical protein
LEKRILLIFAHDLRAHSKQKKFAELDAMADEFRKTKSRFSDGTWKLRCFFSAFYLKTKDPEATYTEYIQLATEWHRNRSSSVTAQGVLAKAWHDYAWKARGGSYAKNVSDEAWSAWKRLGSL